MSRNKRKREKAVGPYISMRKALKKSTARRLGISVQHLAWMNGKLYRTDNDSCHEITEAGTIQGNGRGVSATKSRSASTQAFGRRTTGTGYSQSLASW